MFQTLVAAANSASANLSFANAFLDLVFKGYSPKETSPGSYVSLNILIPTVDEGNANDIGSGPIVTTSTTDNVMSLPFNHKDNVSFVIKSWDQVRTPADLERLYLKPSLEALMRKINRRVAAFATTASFSTYAPVLGIKAASFNRLDLTAAWTLLTQAGVPVEDEADIYFVTSPLAYGNMLGDQNFYQMYVSGQEAAEQAQQKARLIRQYGAQVRYDQMVPAYAGAQQTGLYLHRNAIAMATAPLPAANDPSVKEMIIFPKPDLPVQIQMQYSLKDQGTLVVMNCGHGEAVIRPEYGVIVATA